MLQRPHVRVICVVLATVLTAWPVQTYAAAGKTQRHATNRSATADPVANLAAAVVVNRADMYPDLYHACRGSNFKALAWGLRGVEATLSRPKGEFETDAEFAERKLKLELLVNQKHQLVVCQPLDDNEDAPFEYDADNEKFEGSFRAHQNIWRDVKRTGKYVSHTRMGIRATVTSSIDVEYDLDMGDSLDHLASDCMRGSLSEAHYEVPVPRTDAPSLKSNGYLALVGHLVFPFIESGDSAGSPTLDDPEDVYERDITVHFVPEEIAIVAPDGVRLKCAGVAPPPPPPAPQHPGGATPIDPLYTLISSDDYPTSAFVKGEQGQVHYKLTIASTGVVTDCTIVQSSGSTALDEATCRIIKQRAKFFPAKDANGTPIADTYDSSLSWKLN